ncbi:MAG: LPXTG cell wall anchor domain-containing protein, partial [Atopobiaceae bacterium]|nr:LPXTG cell wall anchor domain-containing protein [Atopobiaceae bacterium]
DGKSITWYTLGADEKLADAIAAGKIDEHKSGSDGVVPAFEGLATGKYTIVESTVPAGFNKAADQDIEVGPVSSDMNLELTASVINRPGSVLPSTGGIGTTIFYVVGGALVITAGVLLVTKRRMANVEA